MSQTVVTALVKIDFKNTFLEARSKKRANGGYGMQDLVLWDSLVLKSQKQKFSRETMPQVETTFPGSIASWRGREATSCG